ncbi:hypothetical protein QR680_010273 [Steinernema hermaphroditum]|uniref:Protein kinase domain-containing protein n=1 Tax=Steinernema hermaphroditum TaxID=289476 RepID=A0AA39MBE8_9BILA|nr:hypothetical protein QR680_010273 [Steinernema hermaphroditum]
MIGYDWDGGHPLSVIADDHNCTIRDRVPHCLLRPIYINAVEVGYAHLIGDEEQTIDEGQRLSVRGVALALWYFLCRGHQAVGILPYCFKKYADKCDDWKSLMELYRMNLIEFTPGFGPEKYSEVNRILAYRARKMGGCMVARSQMHGVVEDNPILDKTVERRLLMPSFNGDDIIFPIDGPLGRSGVTFRQTVVCDLNEVDWGRVAVGQMILKDQRIWLRRLSTLFPDNDRWNIMAHMVTLHQSNVILNDPPDGYPPVDCTVHRIHPPETNPVENPGFSLQRYKKGSQHRARYNPFVFENYPKIGSPTTQEKDYEDLFFPAYVPKKRIEHMKIMEKELEMEYLEKRESDETEYECDCCSPSQKKSRNKRRTHNSNECHECGEVICMCEDFEKDSVEGMSDALEEMMEEMMKQNERIRIGGTSSIYQFKKQSVPVVIQEACENEEQPEELVAEIASVEEGVKQEQKRKRKTKKKLSDEEEWKKYREEFDKQWKEAHPGKKARSADMFDYLDKKAAKLRIDGNSESLFLPLCRNNKNKKRGRKRTGRNAPSYSAESEEQKPPSKESDVPRPSTPGSRTGTPSAGTPSNKKLSREKKDGGSVRRRKVDSGGQAAANSGGTAKAKAKTKHKSKHAGGSREQVVDKTRKGKSGKSKEKATMKEQERPGEDFLDDNEYPMAECDYGNDNSGDTLIKKNEVVEIGDARYIALQTFKGSFGTVDVCEDSQKGKKLKLRVELNTIKCKRMKIEGAVLELAAGLQKDKDSSLKQLIAKGQNEKVNFLVLNTFGRTLSDMLKNSSNRFSVSTILRIGIDSISSIEELHKLGFIHRDIKPQVFSISPEFHLVLTHFGLARTYLKSISIDGKRRAPHIEARSAVPFMGSMRYASRNAHNQRERSRRDDIESWFFMMTELWSGHLLWKKEQDQEKVLEAKCAIFSEGGFDMLRMKFAGYPDEYKLIMRYLASIEYNVAPDYKFLRQEHRDMHYWRFNSEAEDSPYDWEKEDRETDNEVKETS